MEWAGAPAPMLLASWRTCCPCSRSRRRRVAVAPSIAVHHSCRCVAVVATHHRPILLIPSLVGCCVVFHHLHSSSHAVMRQSTLSMPAIFAANRRPPLPLPPPPPPPQLPLPPGHHHRHRHRHHLGRTHHRGFTKKETAAAPPPAYQLPHHCVNVY